MMNRLWCGWCEQDKPSDSFHYSDWSERACEECYQENKEWIVYWDSPAGRAEHEDQIKAEEEERAKNCPPFYEVRCSICLCYSCDCSNRELREQAYQEREGSDNGR